MTTAPESAHSVLHQVGNGSIGVLHQVGNGSIGVLHQVGNGSIGSATSGRQW